MAIFTATNMVLEPIRAFHGQSEVITTIDAFDATTDVTIEIEGLNDKTLLMQNTGGSNSLTYLTEGSIDGGVSWDIVEKADTAVAFGAQDAQAFNTYYTHLRFRVRSTSAGMPTTAVLKLAATGN